MTSVDAILDENVRATRHHGFIHHWDVSAGWSDILLAADEVIAVLPYDDYFAQ